MLRVFQGINFKFVIALALFDFGVKHCGCIEDSDIFGKLCTSGYPPIVR